MSLPILNDTIVAVSTGWEPAPVGVVRLSGPDCARLLHLLGVILPDCERPRWSDVRLQLDAETELPATVLTFRAPRSYTGQDVVEIHTVGCLPLLRELCGCLIEAGARRALPGEFTARALRTGRLDARQAKGVLALMQATEQARARQAARTVRYSQQQLVAAVREDLTRLLALIEAGIDFADEEDVRFISPAQVMRAIDALLDRLNVARQGEHDGARALRPHIALAGLPNAGKSTLFNTLLGCQRALVSPLLGTTRDVLSAEVTLGATTAILQDCAGLGSSSDELAEATHLAAERAAAQADLVLWVHAADMAWDERETAACAQIAGERRILVWTKIDVGGDHKSARVPASFADRAEVSACERIGIEELRAVLARRVSDLRCAGNGSSEQEEIGLAVTALRRARVLASSSSGPQLASAELISLELRSARSCLAENNFVPVDEEILERIFAEFCVGK